MNKLPCKLVFSEGNEPPSYFELRQKSEELVLELGTHFQLSEEQQQNVRRAIVLVLHKTVPAMFIRDVKAPLAPQLCVLYKERLLALLERVCRSPQSAVESLN